jgi:prepilin-type processing-associated H-X9-DG protein
MLYDGNVITNSSQPVQARHNGTFNLAFVDGHVKSIQASETGSANQFVTGKPVRIYTIGANGGFYTGRNDCRGMP